MADYVGRMGSRAPRRRAGRGRGARAARGRGAGAAVAGRRAAEPAAAVAAAPSRSRTCRFMPWAAAVYDYNSANASKYDPEGYCLPPGGPRMMATPYPMEICRSPTNKRIFMIFEGATHIWREIYMDAATASARGRAEPDLSRSLGGPMGRRHAGRRRRRLQRRHVDRLLRTPSHRPAPRGRTDSRDPTRATLRYEATIDDPGAYTRPWTVRWNMPWNATGELTEYICQENNGTVEPDRRPRTADLRSAEMTVVFRRAHASARADPAV